MTMVFILFSTIVLTIVLKWSVRLTDPADPASLVSLLTAVLSPQGHSKMLRTSAGRRKRQEEEEEEEEEAGGGGEYIPILYAHP